MLEFISDTTERLDKFLASKVDVSRGLVQKAIKAGRVAVNGDAILNPDEKIFPGNTVTLPEFEKPELKASQTELLVVFENNDLAVIDKPAGMVVHPGAGVSENTLAQALLYRFPDIKNVGEKHRPGIVHRLDEDTSGLIIVAKTPAGYEHLKKQFLEHQVEKTYIALVHGIPEKLHGIIDVPIEKNPNRRKMRAGEGKEAITEYSVLAQTPEDSLDQYALLKVKLHTGRTHQIRVHMAHIGHPLLSDQTYGGAHKTNDLGILGRQFLHAHRLKFRLLDGTWLELVSELPQDLTKVLNNLGINYHASV
jgi:23S rRNA pseudouridine1911/1915/1917 synthase